MGGEVGWPLDTTPAEMPSGMGVPVWQLIRIEIDSPLECIRSVALVIACLSKWRACSDAAPRSYTSVTSEPSAAAEPLPVAAEPFTAVAGIALMEWMASSCTTVRGERW